jgi:hypothetical protein
MTMVSEAVRSFSNKGLADASDVKKTKDTK